MEYLIKRIQQISNAVWWNIIVRLSDEPVKHLFCSSICSPDIIDELDRHSYDEALFDGGIYSFHNFCYFMHYITLDSLRFGTITLILVIFCRHLVKFCGNFTHLGDARVIKRST